MSGETVYAVTHGSYSDYHIRAVFSTREKAEEYLEISESHGIEEWSLDPPKRSWGSWNVKIDPSDGEVIRAYFWENEDPSRPAKMLDDYGETGAIVGYGRTKEHARRSAENLRRERKAFGGAADPHQGGDRE